MPLVPRTRRPGYRADGQITGSAVPQSAAEMERLLSPAPVHDSDDHLHLKSMAIIDCDGWSTSGLV
jgi:hypothetical protein